MNYPPNSDRSKKEAEDDKNVERVTASEPIRRKKPIGKQLRETFIGGDARGTLNYVVFGVLVPAAREALADAGSQGLERLIFGENRHGKRRPGAGSSSAPGYVSYNRFSNPARPAAEPEPRRSMSRRGRAQHDFEEIILVSRAEAENVIDRMFDLVNQFGSASVADLYELVGIPNNPIDRTWGWTNLQGSGPARVREGFLLDLPDPEPLK